jgi:myosin-1
VIISGESGAGKTEAAKKIMQYVAGVSGSSDGVETVKRVLLETNPLLEAFGNAKTLRNDNSSRFGKYFEILFDRNGDPQGGKITNYLLEKSRVVMQIKGERNFHIFYQLCAGATAEEKDAFQLYEPQHFRYLSQSGQLTVPGVNDAQEFAETRTAMDVVGISYAEQYNIMRLLAAILHLGNMTFTERNNEAAVADDAVLQWVAALLEVEPEVLRRCILSRQMETGRGGGRGSTYTVPLNAEQAYSSRDALSKSVYDRIFNWLVARINAVMNREGQFLKLGILDIYGFEVFDVNGFEQLCINYVNEKLQQIFIELTLKMEQEEYVKEGIKWTPIEFFNNKVVCDLIEGKNPPGIFAIMDDVCAAVASKTDAADSTLLQKLGNHISGNAHFGPAPGGFVVKHYAGDVGYNGTGMTERNKDLLVKDITLVLQSSANGFLTSLYPDVIDNDNRKRPPSAGFRIRQQAAALVDSLMRCTPHYIRCIKPNETKKSHDWDERRCKHQVQYLGLLENVRVRRAGFAFRQTFEKFMARYQHLAAATRRRYTGTPLQGCLAILAELQIPASEYQQGRTKMFIRAPETLFQLEELRERYFHEAAIKIQRAFRRWRARKFYLDLREKSSDIMLNNKERRRMSMFRVFSGDYIDFRRNFAIREAIPQILEINNKKGTVIEKEKVLFAGTVSKIGFKTFGGTKLEPRTLVITERNLFVIGLVKEGKAFVNRVEMTAPVGRVNRGTVSTLSDNLLCLRVGDAGDLLCDCDYKTEILTVLKQANPSIQVVFQDRIDFEKKKGSMATMNVVRDDRAPDAGQYKGKTLHIPQGLPASSVPKKKVYKMTRGAPKAKPQASGGYGAPIAKVGGGGGGGFPPPPQQPPQQQQQQQQAYQPQQSRAAPPPPAAAPRAPPAAPAQQTAKALYAYSAVENDELSFNVGDIIVVTSELDGGGWWQGTFGGRSGIFPSNYVEKLPMAAAAPAAPPRAAPGPPPPAAAPAAAPASGAGRGGGGPPPPRGGFQLPPPRGGPGGPGAGRGGMYGGGAPPQPKKY